MSTRISRSVRLSAEPVATIRIHIIPNAKIDRVVGERGDVIKLRALAVEGKANTALRCFLAEELNIPQRAIMLVRGQTSRDKVIRIDGLREEAIRRFLVPRT